MVNKIIRIACTSLKDIIKTDIIYMYPKRNLEMSANMSIQP